MATAASNPQNMLIIAALGIGAYWYFVKRPVMAGPVATPAGTVARRYATNDANLWTAIGKIVGVVTPAQTRTYEAANAANSGPVPAYGSTPGDPYGGDYAAVNYSPNYDFSPIGLPEIAPDATGWLDF